MSAGYDWMFWSIGSALGLTALWLLYCSLLRDRSGGRRRCPKCWYDMSGCSRFTCSECGYIASHERTLLKTRKHWRRAAVGVFIAALGAGVAATPTTARHGWERIAPTTVLILLMPQLPNYNRSAGDELVRRLHNNDAAIWQWRWLLGRAKGAQSPPWTLTIKTRDAWPENQPLYCDVQFSVAPHILNWFGGVECRAFLKPRLDRPADPIPLALYSTTVQPRRPIDQRVVRIGLPPAGVSEIEMDLLLEIDSNSPGRNSNAQQRRRLAPAKWRQVYSETVRVPVLIRGRLEDYVTPDRSLIFTEQVRQSVELVLDNYRLNPQLDSKMLCGEGFTCPVVIELQRDGEMIKTWEDWWCAASETPMRPWLKLPPELRGDLRPFGTLRYAEFTWSVRVRGAAARALFDFDANRCWGGEFEAPLELMETPEELVFRSAER